jgi:hypothetical protein
VSVLAVTALQLGWAVGAAVFLLSLPVVLLLLNRVLRPLREIKRYSDDILTAGLGIARNLDGIDVAVTTRDLAASLPRHAPTALAKLGVRR